MGSFSQAKQNLLLLWTDFISFLPVLFTGVVILGAFILISRHLSLLLMKPVNRYIRSSRLVEVVIQRIFQLLIILLGFYIFLSLAGLTRFAVAILSGTGLAGIILGFAFRDIAENFIASLLLSIQRPFKLDDVINVQGHTGVVQKVTARATTLVDFDGNHIQVPNAAIYKNVIKNLTANPNMRGHFVIGIGYDSSIRKAQQLILDVLGEHFAVLEEPEPQALVNNLGSSTANLDVYFWINSEAHSIFKVASTLMVQSLRRLEDNNISMPDDAREIIFPEGLHILTDGTSSTGLDETSLLSKTSDTGPANNSPDMHANKTENQQHSEDLSSDNKDIRDQASRSRTPEEGNNIF